MVLDWVLDSNAARDGNDDANRIHFASKEANNAEKALALDWVLDRNATKLGNNGLK